MQNARYSVVSREWPRLHRTSLRSRPSPTRTSFRPDLGLFDWNIYLSHAERHWKGVAKTPPQTVDGREPTFECPLSDAECQFVFDEKASDEFDGETLDRSKWDDWVESFQGRRRGFLFSRDNVDVANGELRLKARLLREDEKTFDNLARGFDTYATAIVKSKEKTFYGYYECRAKSMKAAVCNAFWLYDPLSDELWYYTVNAAM